MDVDGLTCARETSVGLGTRILPAEGTAILLTGDKESTWSLLLKNLRAGDCVPFLGAGACHERIPLGEQMALNWGEMEGYPLADTTNLPRVMQYIATARYSGDAITLKHDFVRREISGVAAPDFSDSSQIHGVLARLDLPLYVTTNYDDFMFLALQHWRKLPRFDYSPWYVTGEGDTHDSPLTDRAYQATPRTPLVYHLHGHYERPQSLVLTEDDYIEYLVQLASDTHHHAGTTSGVLPPFVRGELRSKPLLFIGYSLRDWTFLVLFRTLLHGISDVHRRNHVSVQVDPGERVPHEARDYLEQYLKAQRVQIFWASARDFAHELSSRLGGTTS
jgi:SIR2-like domain